MDTKYICVNRVELNNYMKNNHMDIYDNMLEDKFIPLSDKNILEDMNKLHLFREYSKSEIDAQDYLIPIIVKLVPIYSSWIYLIDESVGSGKDIVKLPGDYIEETESEYDEIYIKSQIVKSMYLSLYRSGYDYWEFTQNKTDIIENSESCGFPIIQISDTWYCRYHEYDSFTIYIPAEASHMNNNISIKMESYECKTMESITDRDPIARQFVKNNTMMGMDFDERCDRYYQVIHPLFNTLSEMKMQLK